MDIAALQSVQCAILHDEVSPLEGHLLFEAVEDLAKIYGFGPHCSLLPPSTQKDLYVRAGPYRVFIIQNIEPLGPEGFQSALSSFVTRQALPDAAAIVERHKANSFITVSKEALDSAACEEAERAMLFCQGLVHVLVGHNPASAIHWCPNDILLSQAAFEDMCTSQQRELVSARSAEEAIDVGDHIDRLIEKRVRELACAEQCATAAAPEQNAGDQMPKKVFGKRVGAEALF